MQRPFFSQSPKRVGSGPARPPSSRGRVTAGAGGGGGEAPGSARAAAALATVAGGAELLPGGIDIPGKSARIRCRQPRTSRGQSTVNSMRSACSTVLLDALGVLRARGQDVLPFLQGQLSNDLTLLSPDRSLLAGYHNPQGRVIALLHLLQLAPDDLLLLLPRELIAPVIARLSKFLLRAKVKLADDSPQWRISGLLPPATAAGVERSDEAAAGDLLAALPASPDATARIAAAFAVRLAQEPARWLLVSPLSQPAPPGTRPAAETRIWQRLAVAAGEPQVYAATSEEFVAQMLNLDCLGAIAFDKGCYTGQEIIARAHYRGRVKRRLQRFVMRDARQLRPADAGTLSDGRAFEVVEAVVLADGRCEFLAVAPLAIGESAPGTAAATSIAGERFDAEALPLPYLLPS